MKQLNPFMTNLMMRYDLGVGLLCLIVGVQLGVFSFLSDSEFWPINAAKYFGSLHTDQISIYYKPLFHLLLKFPYFLDLSNSAHLYFVKSVFGVLGGLIFFSCYLCAKRLWGAQAGWAALTFLITSHLFFTQFYRVRSDILASLFAVLQLIYLVKISSEHQSRRYLPLFVSAGLSLLLIWSTPKAMYFVIVNGFFFLPLTWSFLAQIITYYLDRVSPGRSPSLTSKQTTCLDPLAQA